MHRDGAKEPLLCAAAEASAVAVKGPGLLCALLGCCPSALSCKTGLLLLAWAMSPLWEQLRDSADALLTAWLRAFPLPPV